PGLVHPTSASMEERPMASSTSCKGPDHDDKSKKHQCELIGYEALPEWLKDNEYIHGYYRCEWPMKETILSIFSIHNETLNVWSHLVGFLLFLCLTILTAMVIPRDGGGNTFDDTPSTRSYWGDLMAMANVTGALKHEAAACLLLPPAAADLSGNEEEIPNSCPPNTSSSSTCTDRCHRAHSVVSRAAGRERGATGRGRCLRRSDHAVADVRVPVRSHGVPTYEQRMPPGAVPLGENGVRDAPAGLRRHRRPDRHLLLPGRLLLLPLPPGAPAALHGLHHRLRRRGGHGVAGAGVPGARVPPAPRRALLMHGRVGAHPRRAQARAIRRPAGGRRDCVLRGAHGRALRARRRRLRGARAGAVVPREVRPRRAQPPAVPSLRHRRRVRALPRWRRVPQVEGRRQV
uniref:Uncharacterized protein n=1 Tax=Aegilops tauschii subsp. strangulata TaxID=200361 RepID=A0A453K318_AEGTS